MSIDFDDRPTEGAGKPAFLTPDLNFLSQVHKDNSIVSGGIASADLKLSPFEQNHEEGQEPQLLARSCGWRACYGVDEIIGQRIQQDDQRVRQDVDRKEQELLDEGRYNYLLEQQEIARQRALEKLEERRYGPVDRRCFVKGWDTESLNCPPPAQVE